MQNIIQHFNKIKIESSPRESDFSMLLSQLNTKTELKNNFYTNTNYYTEKVKSPFFAWSFGFAGFSMAAFMFFFNTNNSTQVENLALSDTVLSSSNNLTVEKRNKPVTETINLIDSMSSFNAEIKVKEI